MNGANRESEDIPESRPRPKVVDKRISARPPGEEAPPKQAEPAPGAEPGEPAEPQPEQPPRQAPSGEGTPPEGVWTPEQEEEAHRIAEEMAKAPGRDWVADAATGLANVARMKLSRGETAEASVVIDALAGILEATGSRLGEAEAPLRQVLAQLRLAYADISSKKAPPPGSS